MEQIRSFPRIVNVLGKQNLNKKNLIEGLIGKTWIKVFQKEEWRFL